MDVDIHSTIFQPLTADEPYLVVVSAIPVDQRLHARRTATRTSTALTWGEAAALCDRLATTLREMLRAHGDTVRALHCAWNPACAACAEEK